MTREEWLKKAVRTLRPMLKKAGVKMRPRWQVSMSLTARRSARSPGRRWCWPLRARVRATRPAEAGITSHREMESPDAATQHPG